MSGSQLWGLKNSADDLHTLARLTDRDRRGRKRLQAVRWLRTHSSVASTHFVVVVSLSRISGMNRSW